MKDIKMLLLCAILLFVCTIPRSFAKDNRTTEMSGSYFSGDTFSLNDNVYSVDVNSYEEIILSSNDMFLVVRNGSCTKTGLYYEFCADSIDYDYDKKSKKVLLTVYSYASDILATRSMSGSSVLVGERINITVTLENTGFSTAYNVTYTDIYTTDINISVPTRYDSKAKVLGRKVLLANGSYTNISSVFWQGDLLKDDPVTFIYEITPVKPVDGDFTANVHYFKGYKEVDEATDTVTIKAVPYTDINTNLVDVDYQVDPGMTNVLNWEEKSPIFSGEDMLLVVDIVNNYKENKSINVSNLMFYFPEGVQYIGSYYIRIFDNASDENSSYIAGGAAPDKINNYLYNWSGVIIKDGITFVMKLKATKKGNQIIRVAGDFKKDNMPALYDYSVTKSFDAQRDDIEIESNFVDGKKLTSAQREYFTMYLRNPNTYVNFTDLNVSINLPWSDKKHVHLDNVYAFNYADIFNGNIVMPAVTHPTTLKYYVNVSYTTQFGEKLNKTFERSITVDPALDIEVTHTFGGTIVRESGSADIDNKETEVTLRIRNKYERDLEGVLVTEVINSSLNPAGEISKKVITLKKNENNNIYKYKIDPPDVSVRQNYTIITYVSLKFENQTYNNSYNAEISVKPKTMDLEITKSLSEDEVSKGQIAHFTYKVKNKENEKVNNVTFYFPLQYETDVVGARSFAIDEIPPGETVTLNNEERVRFKINGSVNIEKTAVIFNDAFGNKFNDSSGLLTVSVLKGNLESPAILINKTAPPNVTAGESFTVNLTISNRGNMPAFVTVEYPTRRGIRKYTFKSFPVSDWLFMYNTSVKDTGFAELPANTANYTYGGLDYYTVSNKAEVYSRAKVEKKKTTAPSLSEEEIERRLKEAEEKAEEEKFIINKKYIYIAAFVIMTCLAILFIIKKKPKKGGLDFIEK